MPSTAQDPDQTLQPPNSGTTETKPQAAETGLDLQPGTDNSIQSSKQPPKTGLDLQPQSGVDGGGATLAGRKDDNALDLQPSSGTNTKSSNAGNTQDTELSLQPEKSAGKEHNTDQTLQPPTEGEHGSTSGGGSTDSTSESTKNPIKKIGNFLKKEATRQTDGPPGEPNM